MDKKTEVWTCLFQNPEGDKYGIRYKARKAWVKDAELADTTMEVLTKMFEVLAEDESFTEWLNERGLELVR